MAEVQMTSRQQKLVWLVCLGLLLGAACGGLVYFAYEPVYEASAWLRIDPEQPYVAFKSRGDSRNYVNTQVALIRSPMVLGPVLSQAEVSRLPEIEKEEDPIQWMAGRIEVKGVGQSDLFTISYSSPEPENAALIVNEVTKAYFKVRGEDEAKRTQKVIELLKQEGNRRSAEIERLRKNVRELTKQATGRDPYAANPNFQPTVNDVLAGLQSQLAAVRVKKEILIAGILAFKESTLTEEPTSTEESTSKQDEMLVGAVNRAVEADAEVVRIRGLLSAKRARLREIEARSTESNKDSLYVQLLKEIKQDEAALGKVRAGRREQLAEEIRIAEINRREGELSSMQSQLAHLGIVEAQLQKRYDSKREELMQYGGVTLELEFSRAELARAQEVYDLIAERAVKFRTEQRAPSRVTLMQEAVAPEALVEPVPYGQIAWASLAGFCLPFVFMGLWAGYVRIRAQTTKQEGSTAVEGDEPHQVGSKRAGITLFILALIGNIVLLIWLFRQ